MSHLHHGTNVTENFLKCHMLDTNQGGGSRQQAVNDRLRPLGYWGRLLRGINKLHKEM